MITAWINVVLLGCLFSPVLAAPFRGSYMETDPELTAGFFQGDMEVDFTRNGQISESRHWPNATVPYTISEEFGKFHPSFGYQFLITHFFYNRSSASGVHCARNENN